MLAGILSFARCCVARAMSLGRRLRLYLGK
jgi:hypothetical protein